LQEFDITRGEKAHRHDR